MDKEYEEIYKQVGKLVLRIKERGLKYSDMNRDVLKEIHGFFTLYEAIETRNNKL